MIKSIVILFLSQIIFSTSCDIYMASSRAGGRGLFAGKEFSPDEFFEPNTCISMDRQADRYWSSGNYAYGSPFPNLLVLMIGPGMLFNHGKKNVQYTADRPVPSGSSIASSTLSKPYSTHLQILFYATRNIAAGEELLSNYGENWFNQRGIEERVLDEEETPRSLQYLERQGYCLSNVQVKKSEIPMAGDGLFATTAFKAGDIITVSPALVLPKHEIVRLRERSVLLNYVVSAEGSDAALFLPTTAGMANHGGAAANARFEWLEWKDSNSVESSESASPSWEQSIEELANASYAPLDVKLVATRAVSEGEEVLVDYGPLWEKQWMHYLDLVEMWREKYSSTSRPIPIFRAAIGSGEGLPFPSHFFSRCIGDNRCAQEPAERNSKQTSFRDIVMTSTLHSQSTFAIFNEQQ